MSTRHRLLAAAAGALAEDGFAAASARSIAARAGVNQALVFYHFGSVADLLDAAVRWSVDEAVDDYRRRFAEVRTLPELLALGGELHATEKERGHVAQMAQVMAGAQRDPRLAGAARYAIDAWSVQVEAVLARVLATSPMSGLVAPAGMARAVTAGFIGLQLYEAVDPEAAAAAMDALSLLGVLAQAMEGLGPVANRAMRSRLERAHRPRVTRT